MPTSDDIHAGELIMRAVMALASLDEVVITEAQAADDARAGEVVDPNMLLLRNNLDAFKIFFSIWPHRPFDVANRLLDELKGLVTMVFEDYYQDRKDLIQVLVNNLNDFCVMVNDKNSRGLGHHLLLDRQLMYVKLRMADVFQNVMTEFHEQYHTDVEMEVLIDDFTDKVLIALQDFIICHDLSGRLHADIAKKVLHEVLVAPIHNELCRLSDSLRLAEDWNQENSLIHIFEQRFASLFTTASDLIRPVVYDAGENAEADNVDPTTGEVWQVYEPTELVDVVTGPSNVALDEVSIRVLPKEECGICKDTTEHMRKLKVCVHEFCAGCLSTQLSIQVNYRYKCALCRAKFFSD